MYLKFEKTEFFPKSNSEILKTLLEMLGVFFLRGLLLYTRKGQYDRRETAVRCVETEKSHHNVYGEIEARISEFWVWFGY
jgi:hypothetical protein